MSNWKLGKIQYGFTTTVTAASTLTLTSSSKMYQVFTGTSAHTVQLPDATTLGAGISFVVQNNSTGVITVQNNGAVVLATVAAGSTSEFLVSDISTTNGVWRTYSSGSSSNGGLGSVGPSTTLISTGSQAVFMGGTSSVSYIDSFGFNTLSSATSFGNLVTGRNALNGNGCASSTRAIIGGGGNISSVVQQSMEYVVFTTRSNGLSFGNLLAANENLATMSSSTRGVFACGYTGSTKLDTIQYITMATTGNATSFGTCASGAHRDSMGFASTTRGVWGGDTAGTGTGTQIDFITIATTANSTSFGSMATARGAAASGSNATRGIWAGGENAGGKVSVIDYVTIASTGNGTSFGNLTANRRYCAGAASSLIHTINGGNEAADVTTIEYVNIATTSNSFAFGNLTQARNQAAGCSSCHGGL